MMKTKWKLSIKNIVVLSVAAAVLLSLTLFLALYKVNNVNVSIATGYGYITAEQVRATVDIEAGDRMVSVASRFKSLWFFLDTKSIEELCLNSYIYADSISCSFDHRDLNITVYECKPLFFASCGNSLLLCDTKGKVLAGEYSSEADYPVYTRNFDSFALGDKLDISEDELRYINRLYSAMENADPGMPVLGRIERFSFQNTGDIILMTGDGITINLGTIDNIEENMFTLRKILLEYLCDGQEGYLDFNAGSNPVFTEYK
ncbi:MAG: hypothetical protein IKC38_00730 [Clostridia bacterium]|nr:hypothetical protein [Clostridia bacterium]